MAKYYYKRSTATLSENNTNNLNSNRVDYAVTDSEVHDYLSKLYSKYSPNIWRDGLESTKKDIIKAFTNSLGISFLYNDQDGGNLDSNRSL
ncbi:MAG: hypothetical protein R3Y52_03025 [Psittacicella sp.]